MNFASHLIFVIIITNLDFSFGFFTIGILRDNSKGMMKWSLPSWAPPPSAPAAHNSVVGYRRVVSGLLARQGEDDEGLQPRQLISLGMKKFEEMKVNESIELFNKAEEKSGYGVLTPFLWQRGISLYYADRFQEGSDQFRYDVKVNPFDAEEIVWDIACQNRLKQSDPNFVVRKMALPQGRSDRRKIMRTVYSLFRGDGATEQDLAMAGHSGSPSDVFYALFYLGLYCESINENGKAANYMRAAANSEYARGKGVSDYMTVCAKVHCKLRNWL